ncbi:MAG: UDP-N-acetylglucosamine 2-epimerase (non-hydrolyzing) [Paludibacteraceae bacterium]|nr:UDP-N-acetylglucosamine 2-epimerase (non-hydrolyzing) [Paludibacteraceae bacterium]
MMVHLLTIIGARPQIIKAAAVSRAIRMKYAGQVEEHILHTGQHYDANMSEVFFRELGVPAPDYNLHVGSASHGVQTARMIEGIEAVLCGETKYDGVLVYGDTNSTLAASIAASKLQIPIFHVEAGLRSYNMSMPEEINRIVCDRLSSLLFAPTTTAVQNLAKEGMTEGVLQSGDVMYDNSLYFGSMAEAQRDILGRLGVQPKQFVLATIHRPANTDTPEKLQAIFRALEEIAKTGMEVIVPLHPRTKGKVTGYGLRVTGLKIIEPVSFLEMIQLEKQAAVVLTDSGGVQKEAFFYGTPCVIMRPETEWVEIVEAGAGILADADFGRILAAYQQLLHKHVTFPPLYGDGHASEKILDAIIAYCQK